MCAVSNVGDQYAGQWQQGAGSFPWAAQGPSKYEFEQLRQEVLEMKRLLLEAKEADRKAGNPDCEMEHKIKILKEVAALVGVSLEDVFKPATAITT